MARFRKAVLNIGTYHSRDGTVEVTPDRLKHWSKEHERLKAAKQVVPIDWDHANNEADLQPVTLNVFKRRSAKNTVGHLKEFSVAPDGNSAVLVLDVHDEQAAGKAKANSVFVSPVILNSWRDGAGNEYRDVITHVDFVNHPVDHSQGPFEPADTIACALRMGLSQAYWGDDMATNVKRLGPDDEAEGFFTTPSGAVRPITSGLEEDHKDASPSKKWRSRSKTNRAKRKRRKLSLELDQDPKTLRLASDGDKDKDEKEGDDAPPPAPEPKEPAEPEMIDDNDGDYDQLDEIMDILEEQFAVSLPETTDEDTFLTNLHTALLTAQAHRGGGQSEDAGIEKDGDQMQKATVADPGLQALSLEQRGAIEWAHEQHRKTVATRLSALLDSGRCDAKEYAARKEVPGTLRLSLSSDGKPSASELERWIESREAVPAGTFWSDEQRTKNRPLEAAPVRMGGGDQMTPEEIKELAAWAAGGKRKS